MSEHITLIKHGRLFREERAFISLADNEEAANIAVPPGPVLVPLRVWQARQSELQARAAAGELGVWLAAGEDPAELAGNLAELSLIALHFPKFTDGRSYSAATLLRQRFGYRGELRAIGEVLRDQFNYLQRCGFDALQPAPGRYDEEQLSAALASLADFSQPYQRSVADPLPLFRRIERASTHEVSA